MVCAGYPALSKSLPHTPAHEHSPLLFDAVFSAPLISHGRVYLCFDHWPAHDFHPRIVGLDETYLCSGSLSSLFSWAAISHYHTVMRSYIFIIIFSWLRADAAVKVWLFKADKSDRLAEVGLNLIGSVCDVLCWLKLAAVRSAAKSSCVCHWCHNKHWLMQWDKVQSFLPSDALSASLTDRSSSSEDVEMSLNKMVECLTNCSIYKQK